MSKIFEYLPDLKIVREKPEGENPVFAKSEEDWKFRMKEWTNLKSYPASGFGKEHEGRDLVEGVHFEIDWKPTMGGGAIQAAVPLEAEAEKQGEGMKQLFEYLIQYGGQIISSNDLSPDWINQARASNRMWVDEYGYGFVWEPFVNKLPETVEEVELFEKWFPLKVELPPDLTFENLQERILERKQRKLN